LERKAHRSIVPDGVIPSPFRGMGCPAPQSRRVLATLNSPEKEKGPRHSRHRAIRPKEPGFWIYPDD